MEQLLAHLVGDYLLQSDWMALNKKNKGAAGFVAAITHCLLYGLPFVLLGPSWAQWSFIVASHFAIDRTNVVKHIVWLKNCMGINFAPWSQCTKTGYPDERGLFGLILLVVADNTIHLVCNYFIFKML